jgi:hypothetical protein
MSDFDYQKRDGVRPSDGANDNMATSLNQFDAEKAHDQRMRERTRAAVGICALVIGLVGMWLKIEYSGWAVFIAMIILMDFL